MTRPAQNLLLVALGLMVLWITVVSGEYVNYVKPGLLLPLLVAAIALIVLGAAGLHRGRRAPGRERHGGHDHAPRVAWLLCLPLVAVFVIAPPALGAFTADRAGTAPPAALPSPPAGGSDVLDASDGPVEMSLSEFVGRAYDAQSKLDSAITGVPVKLTGFAAPYKGGEGWYLTRLLMACCAGDAIPVRVRVLGLPEPAAGSWVQVVGTWKARTGNQTDEQAVDGRSIRSVRKPKYPYE